MKSKFVITLLVAITVVLTISIVGAQGPGGRQSSLEFDDSVIQVDLDISENTPYGDALADQVEAGDGAGIDGTFRNSGVVIDEENGLYYAVNGVHPINRGDYTSYYPKSIVAASLETDEIVTVYSFDGFNNHEVDMEALTFAGVDTSILYVGDEYNFIYELDLETGEITREWDLADIGVETSADQGIEALTYSEDTGYFYAGIQGTQEILVIDLGLETDLTEVELIDTWDAGTSPSGLFAHADGQIYMTTVDADQYILRFDIADGTLNCAILIPEALNMARPDGIYITADDATMYVADSQGPLFDGYSMFEIAWTDPCEADIPEVEEATMAEVVSEQVEITLIDPLDGVTNSYCIDIAGGNQNVDPANGLQAHTCYSYQGDLGTDQIFDTTGFASGTLYMPVYDVCAQVASVSAGAKIGLATCDGSDLQTFAFGDGGTISPASDTSLCFTASAETRFGRSDVHQISDMTLAACSDDLTIYQQWGYRATLEDEITVLRS